jgi:DNA-binding protein YbaB
MLLIERAVHNGRIGKDAGTMSNVAKLKLLGEKLSAKRITVESDGGFVRATVDGHGSLLELEISKGAINRPNLGHLEKDIVLTIRKAVAVTEKLHRQLVQSIIRDGG